MSDLPFEVTPESIESQELTEAELSELANLAGEEALAKTTFTNLFLRNKRTVTAALRRNGLFTREEAREIIQNIFTKLWSFRANVLEIGISLDEWINMEVERIILNRVDRRCDSSRPSAVSLAAGVLDYDDVGSTFDDVFTDDEHVGKTEVLPGGAIVDPTDVFDLQAMSGDVQNTLAEMFGFDSDLGPDAWRCALQERIDSLTEPDLCDVPEFDDFLEGVIELYQ